MKNTVQLPSTHTALLTAFRTYLASLGLSSISRKLYSADIARLLASSLFSDLSISTLTNPNSYASYLSQPELSSSSTLLRRTLASLRQFGTFLNQSFDLPNPIANLSITSNTLSTTVSNSSSKYIKACMEYLKDNHLTDSSIRSYKSDITQYLTYLESHHPSTQIESLLTDKNLQNYTDLLTHLDTQSPATIERKIKTIRRFLNWYSSTKLQVVVSDNTKIPASSTDPSTLSSSVQGNRDNSAQAETYSDQSQTQLPDHKHNYVKTSNYRKLRLPTFRTLLSGVILLVLVSTLSIFSYRQFGRDASLTAAFPSTPVTPNRQLSFQGRLENASGTPITAATNFVFKLHDASSGGSELYSSGTCSITPDTDGVFSTQIGGTCGAGIASSVFTENADVWLEVTVGAETLTPRQQIATVAYALNSETIQGFPISATVSAIRNTVVPMNQWGEIIVGEQSPRLTGVSGTFQISAPSLSLVTATGTNGNITLAPDGTGQVNINGNTTTTNFFNVSNAQLTTGSLITGTAANNNTGFKLFDLLSGSSPTSKFSVSDAGLTTVGADLYVSSGISLYNTAVSDDTVEATKFCTGDGETNCVTDFSTLGGSGTSYWRLSNGALSPVNDTLDLLIGSNATSSAKFAFTNINSGTPTLKFNQASNFDLYDSTVNSLSIEGGLLSFDTLNSRLGIGNTTPLAALDIAGSASASGTLTFRGTTDPKINVLNDENFGIQFSPGGDAGLSEKFTILSNGNVGIGVTNPTNRLEIAGTTSTISNSAGDLTIDSFSGNIVFGTDDDLIPTLGAGSADLGSSSAPWDNLYLTNLSYPSAGTITLADNTASAFRLVEGANTYLDITTTNDSETFTLNLPVGGATLHTANLFNSNITQTINIGTGTAIDTINIGTGGTSADDINLGGLSTSHIDITGITNFAGGTTYYVDSSGNAVFNDLIVSDTANPGLTVGNGSVGFARIGGSTVSDNTGNLTLDSDSAAITFAADDTTLTASGLAIIDTAASVAWDVTTLTLGANATVNGGSAANDDLTLQGTSNATRTSSYVLLQPNGGLVGIGDSVPEQELDVTGDIRLTGSLYDTFVTAGISLGATNETALTGFGASSIVGALNELKNSDKNTSHNDYLSWANHYQERAEGSNLTDSEALNGLFFDTFEDSTKFDGTNSTSSGTLRISDNEFRVGITGGQTYSTSTTDNDGQTYLGSNTVNDIYYYDRTRDSSPDVQVELGIDPNWYNGVTLSVATSSAQYSQAGTLADKNPNLTTSYNGSLIKVTGTDTTPRTIYITIKSPTTFDWTNYQGDSSTGVTITPGTAQTLGSTGVSVTFTGGVSYNVGDVFKIASWFIEAEGTNRGAKQQFPERSSIINNLAFVSIVDADTQKVWIKFSSGVSTHVGSATKHGVRMLNGNLYIGTEGSGIRTVKFYSDATYHTGSTSTSVFNTPISLRNSSSTEVTLNSVQTLVNDNVNDVDAAVIPNQPTQEVTVSGWGYIAGNSTGSIGETVNLPYKFNATPIINLTLSGYSNGSAPTSLSGCNASFGTGGVVPGTDAAAPTTNSFYSHFSLSSGAFGATQYICYTWTATGTVSPKQFVAVATGASGADGGTTIINETDGTKADLGVGSQTGSYIVNQTNVALANNTIYTGNNDYTSNLTRLNVQYGVHSIRSDTSLHEYRNGSYRLGAQDSWSTTGPTILGSSSGTEQIKSLVVTPNTSTIDPSSNTIYVGTTAGLSVIQENQGHGNITDGFVESSGSVKYYTKDYISEEMIGDVRGMWPLNASNTASDLEDVSVKANTLTATNISSADAVSGVRGEATDFDGSSEYMSCTDGSCGGTSKLDIGSGNWSMGAWVKTTLSSRGAVISKGSGGAYSYEFGVNSDGTVLNDLHQAGGSIYMQATSNRKINDGNWHHIVSSYTVGNRLETYIDGQLDSVDTSASGTHNTDTAATFEIGRRADGNYYFLGSIDEPFVTATTLTPAQIKNMYQVGYRALQSHDTGLSSGTADGNQTLAGASNNIGVVAPDYNNQYMYVGTNHTTDGALTKIQLNSDTAIKSWDAGDNDPDGGTQIIDDDINSLAVGYQLEAVGSAASGVKSMAPDNNANALTGSLFSKTQTLNSSTKFAYFWTSVYTDSSDAASLINVYACNNYATKALCDSNNAWVLGTTIQTDSTQSPPEREYNFAFPNTGSYLTFKIDFKRTDNKSNTYIERYGASWASSVGGADIAERYQSSEPVFPGDIVTIDSPVEGGVATVKKSSIPYDQKVIGVVTTNPGIVMDENLVDLNWNASSRNSPDRPAVALAGRIPVNVSTKGGSIEVGDPITTSNIPGYGVRANQSGTIVAKALESFDCDSPTAIPMSDGTCQGQVLAFANITHYERSLYLSDLGDFVFTTGPTTASDSATSAPFRLVRVLADGTQEIVDKIGTFGTLIAESIKGQNLAIDTISPLASGSAITVEAPVIIKSNPQTPDLPTLVVEGEIEASTISARTAILDTLEVKNIIADRITANQIEGLEATIATLSAGTTTQISDSDLESITDRIKARLEDINSPATAEDIPVPQESLDSQTPSEAIGEVGPTATSSATLASADIDFATINTYLAVVGTATITTLDVTNGIYTDSISSKSGLLALGENTLLIDNSGSVVINGDLTVSGKILASSAALGTLEIGAPSSATESALGKLLAIYDEQGAPVATIDASGSANLASLTTNMITIASPSVATSSGLASLLGTAQSNATAGQNTLESPNTELTIESPYVTANSLVYLTPTTNTDNKVVFVKSKNTCNENNPELAEGSPCIPAFTIAIDAPANTDISFNWWIIELQQ